MSDDDTAMSGTGTAGDADPPVPDEIKEAARRAPDHWLGMVDPAWTGEGTPPNWAVVGEWRSGLDGEIEEWRANEEYRPSPQALDWPAPTDPVDEAVQLAATGYGPGDAVTETLAGAEVAVPLAPGGAPLSATSPDGEAVVPVYTSPTHLHAGGRLGYGLFAVPDLLERVPDGHMLYLNPSGPVGMTVHTDALRTALERTSAHEEETPSPVPDPPANLPSDPLPDVLPDPSTADQRQQDMPPTPPTSPTPDPPSAPRRPATTGGDAPAPPDRPAPAVPVVPARPVPSDEDRGAGASSDEVSAVLSPGTPTGTGTGTAE